MTAMSWQPEGVDLAAPELTDRLRAILLQLDTGDYLAAGDAMRHCTDDELPDDHLPGALDRIRLCLMDARAELIHLSPDTARAYLQEALTLAARR